MRKISTFDVCVGATGNFSSREGGERKGVAEGEPGSIPAAAISNGDRVINGDAFTGDDIYRGSTAPFRVSEGPKDALRKKDRRKNPFRSLMRSLSLSFSFAVIFAIAVGRDLNSTDLRICFVSLILLSILRRSSSCSASAIRAKTAAGPL